VRRQLPTDDEVTAVMNRVLAEAAEHGHKVTVTAVERALDIPHATFDRNYRHLIEGFRQRAREQSTTTNQTLNASASNAPDQIIQRLRRENEDLRRLVNIYAESIRQLTLDNLDLETKLNAAANITTLPTTTRRPPGR